MAFVSHSEEELFGAGSRGMVDACAGTNGASRQGALTVSRGPRLRWADLVKSDWSREF